MTTIKKKCLKEGSQLLWKGKDQRLAVLVAIKGKTYQVALDENKMKSVLFVLIQMFPNGIIKVLPDEIKGKLTVTLPTPKHKKI